MAQSEVQGTPAQKPAVTAPSDPADQESHDTKDLEQLLKRYNTDSKKVLEDNYAAV